MTATPAELEDMLGSALTSMMQQVTFHQPARELASEPVQATRSSRAPSHVVLHLAKELGRFLVPTASEDPRLTVVWRGRSFSIGAAWTSRRAPPTVLSAEAIAACARLHFDDPPTEIAHYEPIRISWWGAGRSAIRLALQCAPDHDCVELVQAGLPPGDDERWAWFAKYVGGLTNVYQTMRGLVFARIGALREHLGVRVQALRDARALALQDRVETVLGLLPELEEIGAADLIEEILTSLLLAVFGTGGGSAAVPPSRLFEGVVARVRTYANTAGAAVAPRLLAFASCFEAVTSPATWVAPAAALDGAALWPLAMWTRVHELSRRKNTLQDAADAAWDTAAAVTGPVLVHKLEQPLSAKAPPDHARNWLVLWFCLEILHEERARRTDNLDKRRELRAALSYALREALRFDQFGKRADYVSDASALARAIARLVVYHAVRIAKLPAQYHVNAVMQLVSGVPGASARSSIEHLQHVADIYLAGHFLLALRVQGGGAGAAPCTAGELFAGSPLPGVIDKLRCAFSMAALFHDVGHVFLPAEVRLPASMLVDDRDVKDVLQTRPAASAVAAARALTATCLDQLRLGESAPATGAVYFDREDGRRLGAWFEDQAASGQASHGLLGAWYLDRVCHRAEALDGNAAPAALREIRRMAVRAIILHDAVTETIQTDDDPIAALLVTSNEIFDWSPGRAPGSAAHASARPLAGSGPATYQMDRSIEIRGLRITAGDGAERFRAVMEARGDGMWPDVVVELMPPEYLDVKVFRVWLAKAQAIGRIGPGTRSRFSPRLLIRSALDPELAHRDRDTRRALSETIEAQFPAQPELLAWFGEAERFRSSGGYEEVRLGYLRQQICQGSIEALLPQLERGLADYLAGLAPDDD